MANSSLMATDSVPESPAGLHPPGCAFQPLFTLARELQRDRIIGRLAQPMPKQPEWESMETSQLPRHADQIIHEIRYYREQLALRQAEVIALHRQASANASGVTLPFK